MRTHFKNFSFSLKIYHHKHYTQGTLIMLKLILFISFLIHTSLLIADDSKIDQDFINLSSNWNQFREMISKPDSKSGESEYEKTVRSKLLELTHEPHKALLDAAAKDHQTRKRATFTAQQLSPLINIWTEEWRRSIELRKIQSDIQKTGDSDLTNDLAKNLENSVHIRQSQLDLLKYNNNYVTINSRVSNKTKKIIELKEKNQNQAQVIEKLKKELAAALKKSEEQTKKAAASEPIKKPAAKKVPVKKFCF